MANIPTDPYTSNSERLLYQIWQGILLNTAGQNNTKREIISLPITSPSLTKNKIYAVNMALGGTFTVPLINQFGAANVRGTINDIVYMCDHPAIQTSTELDLYIFNAPITAVADWTTIVPSYADWSQKLVGIFQLKQVASTAVGAISTFQLSFPTGNAKEIFFSCTGAGAGYNLYFLIGTNIAFTTPNDGLNPATNMLMNYSEIA